MSKPARYFAPESSVSRALRVPPWRFRQSVGRESRAAPACSRGNRVFENGRKTVFHRDRYSQIRTVVSKQLQRRGTQNAIAQRPQPDDGDPAVRGQPVDCVGLCGHELPIRLRGSVGHPRKTLPRSASRARSGLAEAPVPPSLTSLSPRAAGSSRPILCATRR